MPQTAVHTPVQQSKTDKLGRVLYRKQVLPVGSSIAYNGQTLTFDKQLADNIVAAHNAGAYDDVPLLLADPATNAHHMNAELQRGSVQGYEATDDGLYALLSVTPEMAQTLDNSENKLGVSARIMFDLTRADGAKFPAAIQHVLATLDPRVTGMKPWERITDLASDPTPVVDLTAMTYEGDTMPLSDEMVAKLSKFAEKLNDDGELPDGEPLSVEDLAALAALEPDAPVEPQIPDPAAVVEPVQTPAPQVPAVPEPVSLANAQLEATNQRVADLQADLAKQRFANVKGQWLKDGVPPAAIDLAAPILEMPTAAVVDLSNGQTADPAAVIAGLLDQMRGVVDLSRLKGIGEDHGEPEADEHRRSLAASWHKQYGL